MKKQEEVVIGLGEYRSLLAIEEQAKALWRRLAVLVMSGASDAELVACLREQAAAQLEALDGPRLGEAA